MPQRYGAGLSMLRWLVMVVLAGGCDCGSRSEPDPGLSAAEALDESQALASAVAASEGTACERAREEIARLRALVESAAPPALDDFVGRCQELPPPVQECLRPSQASHDPAGCAALVEALPERERALARALARAR